MDEKQESGRRKIHIALVTGQYESENAEALQLLDMLKKQCASTAEAHMVSGKRIEMIDDDLRRNPAEIIHFCGPCNESGHFIIQNRQGRVIAKKHIHQLVQCAEALPYHVVLICFPSRMTSRKPWQQGRGKGDFLIGMKNHEILKKQVPFYSVFYPLFLKGKSLKESFDRACGTIPDGRHQPTIFFLRRMYCLQYHIVPEESDTPGKTDAEKSDASLKD